jgi:hypothetical protein
MPLNRCLQSASHLGPHYYLRPRDFQGVGAKDLEHGCLIWSSPIWHSFREDFGHAPCVLVYDSPCTCTHHLRFSPYSISDISDVTGVSLHSDPLEIRLTTRISTRCNVAVRFQVFPMILRSVAFGCASHSSFLAKNHI